MLKEPDWLAMRENCHSNIYFNKILYHLDSNYPAHQHMSVIKAINEFNKRLKEEKEPTPTPTNAPKKGFRLGR